MVFAFSAQGSHFWEEELDFPVMPHTCKFNQERSRKFDFFSHQDLKQKRREAILQGGIELLTVEKINVY